MKPPADLDSLQVALSLDNPSGPEIARWRDHYAGTDSQHLVNLCIEVLHEQQLCYSCGQPGDRLVEDEYPWACGSCQSAS